MRPRTTLLWSTLLTLWTCPSHLRPEVQTRVNRQRRQLCVQRSHSHLLPRNLALLLPTLTHMPFGDHLLTSSTTTFRPAIVEDSRDSTLAASTASRLAYYHDIRNYWGEGNGSAVTIREGKERAVVLAPREVQALVDCLAALTQDGRDIDELEEVCELLLHWIRARMGEFEDTIGTLSDPKLDTPLHVHCSTTSSCHLSAFQLLTNVHRFSMFKLSPQVIEGTFQTFIDLCFRTTSEDDLFAFLDHVAMVVEIAEVPATFLPTVVSIVAKIIGLKHRALVLADFDTTSGLFGPEQRKQFLDLFHRLQDRAYYAMERLLISPGNQALRCLRKFTSPPSEEEKEKGCDVLLLVGSLRSLSFAIRRYDEDHASVPEDPTTVIKVTAKWPPILHRSLRSFLYQNLKAAMGWKNQDVDAEVISLVDKIQKSWEMDLKNAILEEGLEDYEEEYDLFENRRGSATDTTGSYSRRNTSATFSRRSTRDSVDDRNDISFEEWNITFEVLSAATPSIKSYEEITRKPFMFKIAGPADLESYRQLDPIKSPSVNSFEETDNVIVKKSDSLTQLISAYDAVFHRLVLVLRTHSFSGPVDHLFELLTRLAPHLSEMTIIPFLDQCQRDLLFYPAEEDWLQKLHEALTAFYVEPYASASHSVLFKKSKSSTIQKIPTSVRRKMLAILKQLHMDITEMETYRDLLTMRVIIPLLEQTLPVETEAEVAEDALMLLVSLAQAWFKLEMPIHSSSGNRDFFERLKSLFLELTKAPEIAQRRELPPSIAKGQRRGMGLSMLRNPKEASTANLKAPYTLTSPLRLSDQSTGDGADIPVLAMGALVSLFHIALDQSSRPSLVRCVHIFRDLIELLFPAQSTDADSLPDGKDGQITKQHPVPVRARLVILQWLMRLRAGPDHRIYFVQEVDVFGLAEQLRRTAPQSVAEVALSSSLERDREDSESRGRVRSPGNSPSRQSSRTSRERSSSRTPRNERSPSRVRLQTSLEHPQLWTIPDVLPFVIPTEASLDPRPVGECGLVSLDTELMSDYDENQTDAEREVSGIESDVITDQSLAPQSEGVISKYVILPTSDHFQVLIRMLRYETSWELISYILCYLPQQLANKHFSAGPRASQQLNFLRKTLCDGLQRETLQANVLLPRNVKRAEVYSVAYQTLVTLLAYPGIFSQSAKQETVQTFVHGLSKYKETAKPCIHALAISCYDLDQAMTKSLPEILQALSKIISMSEVAVHVLELIASIAQVSKLHVNFTDEDFRTVFAISLKYIAQHKTGDVEAGAPAGGTTYAFQQYVLLLAYYLIAVWYLAIRLPERKKYVSFITERLVTATFDAGYTTLDDATEVCLDMLARYAYANAEPRPTISAFDRLFFSDPLPNAGLQDLPTKSWVIGHSVISVASLPRAAWTQIVVRRASGKVSFLCETQNISGPLDEPDRDAVDRFLREQRLMQVVDAHKIGVIYVAPKQSRETEILRNTAGSKKFVQFLSGLGSLLRLKGTHGLDVGGLDTQNDLDGKWTFVWQDQLTQIVFHIPTLMPTLPPEQDPLCIHKKKHVGNDYVNIIFNESGQEFLFDTISTQFTYVNIVIEPHTPAGAAWTIPGMTSNTEFYKVTMLRRPDMPEMGPLGDFKMVSTSSLANLPQQRIRLFLAESTELY
ncbi:hypothetical protein BT69DRAFT_269711 [Atractiella rhizophila]|nr:hypothetical protein BT69DRAFT_269711 [Atractiella rhizophila]